MEKTASAIGLYRFTLSGDRESVMVKFYEKTLSFFERINVSPTYVGIEGVGFTGDYRKFQSRQHKKAQSNGFSGVMSLSIVANPEDSDEPAYDAFASCSLAFSEADHSSILSIVVNETLLKLGDDDYEQTVAEFSSLQAWDYGIGFSGDVRKEPDLYVLGMDSGKLSSDERTALRAWYAADGEKKKLFLRGVYTYNLLNERQLSMVLSSGKALKDYLTSFPDVDLEVMSNSTLILCHIKNHERVLEIEKCLGMEGALIK